MVMNKVTNSTLIITSIIAVSFSLKSVCLVFSTTEKMVLKFCNFAFCMSFCNFVHINFFRFIVHNDANNPYIESLERFTQELKTFKPSLLAVGGLQMMDKFPFLEGTSFFNTHGIFC